MKQTGNTIVITGGGSGLGRGFAEAFHALGNKVIITGRRANVLAETAAANPGMEWYAMDASDAGSIASVSEKIVAAHPAVNVVMNNAGVQRYIDFTRHYDDGKALEEINTNILGLMRVTAAFLPQLREQKDAVIVNITSGLAFVPLAKYPVYCASKAFVHSFSVSLRHQLRKTGVRVVELAPPWVESGLHDQHPPEDTAPAGMKPMPQGEFITAAMAELASGQDELAVAGAKFMHGAAAESRVADVFARMNS